MEGSVFKMPLKVLFLCTGNSCRSQMAEGWTNHLFSHCVKAYSAGTRPAQVHPLAARVMKEAGVDISFQHSKHLSSFLGKEFNLAVTLCDSAKEECPYFPGAQKILHYSFPDPAVVEGTEEKKLEAFREVRDSIKRSVRELLTVEIEGLY